MTTLSAQQIAQATGANIARAMAYAPALNTAMAAYAISTPERQAAFLAQIGHETCSLVYLKELWGPTPAQVRYEGRKDLGNTQKGDGKRFMGHGLIQVTGRHNHARVRDKLRKRFPALQVPDFEQEPEKLMQAQWAALSACDYWDDHNINALADAGDFTAVTRAINGGTNGLADRQARWAKAKQAIITSGAAT